jgi:hypothetical protein
LGFYETFCFKNNFRSAISWKGGKLASYKLEEGVCKRFPSLWTPTTGLEVLKTTPRNNNNSLERLTEHSERIIFTVTGCYS